MLCAITMATCRVDTTPVGTVYSLWFAYIIDTTANGKIYTLSKNAPALKQCSSKLEGSILMTFGGNIQKTLE